MAKTSTIDLDLLGVGTNLPNEWTGEHVRRRLVEAYRIERRLPFRRPGSNGSVWPELGHSFAEMVHWDDARERVLAAWSRTRTPVYAAELTRLEQAHEWLRVLLADHETERACLAAWSASIAYRRSLRRKLRSRNWSRTTFYRRVALGSWIIARRLNAEGVPVT